MIFRNEHNEKAALDLVAICTGLTPADIKSQCRHRDVVLARQCLAYVYRHYMQMQWTAIGAAIGAKGHRKDHSTAMHSVRRFKDYLDVRDEKATELWDMVISRLDSVVDSGCRVMVRVQNKDMQKLLTILEKAGYYYEVV